TNRPWYAGFGPIVTALGTGLLPYSPNYAAMLLCVGIYSIGSAAFHPQGCGSVGQSFLRKDWLSAYLSSIWEGW
ncbi:MAG TPA: hypothetical protein PK364_04735, partial [Synergistaceae bacterium]|nr:hypothetical protein [Synergistaceae bacterium]